MSGRHLTKVIMSGDAFKMVGVTGFVQDTNHSTVWRNVRR